jgi:hypothetical protein
MPTDRQLDWDNAPPVGSGGIVRVLVSPPPDESWLAAFKEVGHDLVRENRNQKYDRLTIEDGELIVTGVDAAHVLSTADFLDTWMLKANRAARRREQEHAQAAQARERRLERAASDAQSASELLRSRK